MASTSGVMTAEIRRVQSGKIDDVSDDVLAVEEPLEIRVKPSGKSHRAVSITMRTPGGDGELATGFLFTEGILTSPDQIEQIHHCGLKIGKANGALEHAVALNSNTIRVDLRDGIDLDLKGLERNFYTTSSCGVCGKASIEALRTGIKPLALNILNVRRELIHSLSALLRESQSAFDQTGGLHASALFDQHGSLDIVREDVGRHNALDKVIGAKFLDGKLPLSDSILLVSGRASFELVQKALMAGIPILAAVGAPSSLAVELAAEYGMTLLGFVREGRFNIYCGRQRIVNC
ncbi:MAG: formate dehydrogenase accessory sulfurtransferase FdhD [Pyrinomonadaceae bacterium]